jgi:hypothetical protein
MIGTEITPFNTAILVALPVNFPTPQPLAPDCRKDCARP